MSSQWLVSRLRTAERSLACFPTMLALLVFAKQKPTSGL
jgi:hypothetical protein